MTRATSTRAARTARPPRWTTSTWAGWTASSRRPSMLSKAANPTTRPAAGTPPPTSGITATPSYPQPGAPPHTSRSQTARAPPTPHTTGATQANCNRQPSSPRLGVAQALGKATNRDDFRTAARTGTPPAVMRLCPTDRYTEHQPALVSDGPNYVTTLTNAVMQG